MSLTKVSYSMIDGAVVNILDFGASPDATSAANFVAIQAAIDYVSALGSGEVFFPQGIYLINAPLVIKSNIRYRGVRGFVGSVLSGTHGGDIFTFTGEASYIELNGLAFYGAGCTGIHGTTVGGYMNSWHIHDCDFYANLSTCIRGNMILCDIGPQNTFGYFGTAGASHSHIVSTGDPAGTGNTTNINRIFGNRFWNAGGAGVGVQFDGGYHLVIQGNDFESNSVQPLTINGIYGSEVRDNWFENNAFTSVIGYNTSTAGAIPNLVNVVNNNWFKPHASTTNLIEYSGAGAVVFTNNTGTTMGGKTITNSADAFVSSSFNNALNGSTIGNFSTWSTLQTVAGIGVGYATPQSSGIAFPATAIDIADPNTLDDYEEGTITPTLSGFTVAGTPVVSLKYTKIGNIVNFKIEIDPNGGTVASVAGTSYVTGLPFGGSDVACSCAVSNANTAIGDGTGSIQGDYVYPPSWGASADIRVISGFMFAQS